MNRRSLSQQGFTLVELMIALTLGLILTMTVSYTYLASRQVSKQQEASSLIQQNARMAFEIMGQSIRMAGYSGCGPMLDTANNVLNAGDWYVGFSRPILGYDDADTNTIPGAIKSLRIRGDVLTILSARNESNYIVESYTKSSAQFKLTSNHDIKQGEILIVSDCNQSSIFQMSNVNNNNNIDVIVHNSGNAITPGNSTKDLGDYRPGAVLLKANASAYYIANNNRGEPSLYARLLQTTSSGNAADTSEELIEGVQDMQILYGVDTSATADRVVDRYIKANEVTSTVPGANDDEKWQRVLAVRISLLMVSPQGSSITSAPQTYTFAGNTITPSDKLLRKVVTTTIAVRNRL